MDIDFLLIQKMKQGNPDAVDAFVEKYYEKILQYCFCHVRSRIDAEDLTQETFEKFFRTFDHYKHYGKLLNYLYVIAGNLCRDYYGRRKELLLERDDRVTCEQGTLHHDSPDNCIEQIMIHQALDALPDEIRSVAILYFVQECRQQEIAGILGIGLSLVKYRIRRARELLKVALGEEEKSEAYGSGIKGTDEKNADFS